MEMIDLLRTRRSVRKFTGQKVEQDKLNLLKETVLRAPTSKDSKAWEFIFVEDTETIQQLSESKPHGAAMLKTAPLAVVVLANEQETGAWVEDCSIAAILLQLSAHSLGLGSCWVQIRGREYSDEKMSETYIQELMGIPKGYRVLCIVAIGYSQKVMAGKSFDELDFSKIHSDRY